jgi:hypothetical protein
LDGINQRKNSSKNRNVPKKRTNNDFNFDNDPFVFVEGGIDDLVILGIKL